MPSTPQVSSYIVVEMGNIRTSVIFVPFSGQINDLADKLETWDNGLSRVTGFVAPQDGSEKKTEDKLNKATKDACKITTEVLNGIMTQVIKDRLFNNSCCKSGSEQKRD